MMDNFPFSESLTQIKKILLTVEPAHRTAGLLSGRMGLIIFLYELAKVDADPKVRELLSDEIAALQHTLGKGLRNYSLHSGTAGIFWAKNYLSEDSNNETCLFKDREKEAALLRRNLHFLLQSNNIDYLHGLSGIVKVLGACQLLSTQDAKLVLEYFKKTSINTEYGLSWYNEFHKPYDQQIHYGIAHGIAGFLNIISTLPIPHKDELIFPGVNNLYHHVLAVSPSLPRDFKCKSHGYSWCASQTGASVILLRLLKKYELTAEYSIITELLLRRFETLNKSTAALTDLCLCHGGAGMMIMLNTLYLQTGEEAFRFSYNKLSMEMIEGFANRNIICQTPEHVHSLLTGLPGVGMAFLELNKQNKFLLNVLNLI